jgi:Flp pilus assembly protein TadD
VKKSKLVVWGSLLLAMPVLAAAAAHLPNLDATLKAQRKLVDANPNDAVAQNDLGNLLEESGDPVGAELAYQKAIALDPQAAAAHFNLALLYQQQKKDRKAIGTFEDLLEIDPGHAWAHYQLGVLFEKKGRRNAAIEEYARAFAIDPGLSFPRNNPQILDSSLATESLLRAESYLTTAENRVPRQFNDSARIRNLLLTKPAKEGGPGAAPEAAAAEAGGVSVPEEGSKPRATTSNAALPSAAAETEEAAPRVITNDDLEGGSAATQRGSRGRSTTTSSPRGSSTFVAPTYAAPPVQKGAPNAAPDNSVPAPSGVFVPSPGYDPLQRKPPAGAAPTAPGTTPAAPNRFQPGRRSTASLGWQLEPSGPAAG